MPTVKTNKNHKPTPEKMVPLFSTQPFGEAKVTGTPITKRKDTATNAKRLN